MTVPAVAGGLILASDAKEGGHGLFRRGNRTQYGDSNERRTAKHTPHHVRPTAMGLARMLWSGLGEALQRFDALALEGVVYERCYCNNPICTPSRASLMTGKELPGHGVFRLFDNLPTNEVMFTERLRKLGYETALFGKLHVSGRLTEEKERHPHDGFDTYEWCIEPMVSLDSPFNGYRRWLERHDPAFLGRLRKLGRSRGHDPAASHMTRWAADRTIDFLSSRRDSPAPFFCMMSVFDPHNPYNNYPVEARSSVDASLIPSADPRGLEGSTRKRISAGTPSCGTRELLPWPYCGHGRIGYRSNACGLFCGSRVSG